MSLRATANYHCNIHNCIPDRHCLHNILTFSFLSNGIITRCYTILSFIWIIINTPLCIKTIMLWFLIHISNNIHFQTYVDTYVSTELLLYLLGCATIWHGDSWVDNYTIYIASCYAYHIEFGSKIDCKLFASYTIDDLSSCLVYSLWKM